MAHTLITDRRTQGSNYKILRRLGKGGMAEVFLARQEGMAGLRRLTVIKKILPQLSEVKDVAEMLLDEARIAAQLTHPNVVQIYELGQEEGQYFIAMEFVDGCDLATLARIERHRQSRIPLRLTLRVLSEAAMALDYAHRQVSLDGRPLNLVHRDVSPHNVLCSREGAVKVTDFGISKFAGKSQLTQVGVVKGKVQYMSPEQYRGAALDHRSDIFSIGVVLYQLTVGKLPRVTESGQVAIKRVVEGKIPRPTELRPEYPEELEAIVMRALAQNPEERYPDANSMRDDLLEFAREHDLLAFPKELGEYVNQLVPPSKLVVEEQSVVGVPAPDSGKRSKPRRQAEQQPEPVLAKGRKLPSVIVDKEELHTEAPRGTEVASDVGRHRKPSVPRARAGTEVVKGKSAPEPEQQNTDIPITSSRAEPGAYSEPAVLPEEDFTPTPIARGPAAARRPSRRPRPESTAEPAPTPWEEPAAAPQPQDQRSTQQVEPMAPPPPAAVAPTPAPAAAPPPPMVAAPERRPAVGGVVLLTAIAALLVASGSLAYLFFGDRPSDQPTALPVAGSTKTKIRAGVIHLHSNPSTTSVSIDGAQRCPSTPCRIAGLPLGRELLITLRSKGYTLWMQRVVLTPHQPRLMLRADLTPIAGVARPAAAPRKARPKASPSRPAAKATAKARPAVPRKGVAAARPTPRKPRPAAKTAAQPKRKNMVVTAGVAGKAVLVVDVRPWAEVWIDGQKIGHTPLQKELPPGKYKVVLKNPGLKYEKTFPVVAKVGKKVKIIDAIRPPGQ